MLEGNPDAPLIVERVYSTATSRAAIRNVRFAQIAVIHGPCGEQPKAEVDLSTGIDASTSTRIELAIVK
jgi:hypothetical protein